MILSGCHQSFCFWGTFSSPHTPCSFRSFSAQTRTDLVLFRNAYFVITNNNRKKNNDEEKTNHRRVFVMFPKLIGGPHRAVRKTKRANTYRVFHKNRFGIRKSHSNHPRLFRFKMLAIGSKLVWRAWASFKIKCQYSD